MRHLANNTHSRDAGRSVGASDAGLERDLRHALARDQLQLAWQPQVSANGNACGVEALLRWNHPTRGPISPATFIPIAERTGLILTIGRWVIGEAARTARQWHDAGLDLRVAANVSPMQFEQDDFVGQVADAIDSANVDPRRLELELTETMLMRHTAADRLSELRSLGVAVALDDFGTGYSCLAYLESIPLDTLKIDRSFVAQVTDASIEHPFERRTAVLRAIVSLAQTLGLGVVAEGVETDVQRRYLLELECDVMQGYLFSRPVTAQDLPDVVRMINDRARAARAADGCLSPIVTGRAA